MPARARNFQLKVREVLHADLQLDPFYRKARRDEAMRPVVESLAGLKPIRPPDIFQMMVIALSEQQVSMAAAQRVRERFLSRHGAVTGRLMAFPQPGDVAVLEPGALRACGFSTRKAEYLVEMARMISGGAIDPLTWDGMEDEELIGHLRSYRGIGEWTAEYILARGLGRMDVAPASDLGVRRAVGSRLAGGKELTAEEVRGLLEPWRPYRGLVAFYLLAHQRLTQMGLDQAQ
jgi:DNA-3-methyladenine glycosylase II